MAESERLIDNACSNPNFLAWLKEQKNLLSTFGLTAMILENKAHAIMVELISKPSGTEKPKIFLQAIASYDEESAVSRPNRPLEESVCGIPIKKIQYEVRPLFRPDVPTLSLNTSDSKKWDEMAPEDQARMVAYCLTTGLTILRGKYDRNDIHSCYQQMYLLWLKRASL